MVIFSHRAIRISYNNIIILSSMYIGLQIPFKKFFLHKYYKTYIIEGSKKCNLVRNYVRLWTVCVALSVADLISSLSKVTTELTYHRDNQKRILHYV